MANDPLRTPADAPLTLGVIYTLVLRRASIFGLCVAASLVLMGIYLLVATPLYESTAVLEVQRVEHLAYTPADKGEAKPEDDTNDDTQLKTIEQALQLDGLIDEVASAPQVVADPHFLPGLGLSAEKPPTTSELRKALRNRITVKLRHDTRLIDVSVDHPDPKTAQLLASTLVNSFITMHGHTQTDSDQTATSFLEGQTTRFEADLQRAQDALQVYRDAILLKDQISDQEKTVSDLAQVFGPEHPKLIAAKAELGDLQQRFENEIESVVAKSPTEASYWQATLERAATQSPEDRLESELKLVEARSNVLQREADTQSVLFDSVMKQMREAEISKDIAPVMVTVDQPALLPESPAKPRKLLLMLVALAAGLAAGVLAVIATHSLDSSLKHVPDVEQALNLAVLACVPMAGVETAEQNGRNGAGSPVPPAAPLSTFHKLPILDDPSGPAAENIRSLRAAIELLGRENDHKVILFCSALSGEGKTFTSCNFAASLAQQGRKTLLIDADLRRPGVYQLFDLSEKSQGLIEHISRGTPWEEVVHRNVVENLDVLLPGVKCPNPAELLGGDGLRDVIRGALTKYDRIIIDTAPINAVSDTLLIAPHVQSICLVVRSEVTPRGAAERALRLLEMAKVRPVGVVLNGVSTDWKSAYGHQYYVADHRYGNQLAGVGAARNDLFAKSTNLLAGVVKRSRPGR
jgi:capsular exopolysaccharide synthesis family protein